MNFLSDINFLGVVSGEKMLLSPTVITSPPTVVGLSDIVYDGVFTERKLVRLVATIVVQRFHGHLIEMID